MRTPEFCSTCHKVALIPALNGYRWMRGQNHYDTWYDSGVSGRAVRSFYDPPQPKACRDCHLPAYRSDEFGNKKGFLHDHVFPAANTALPFVRGDRETEKKIRDFLQNKVLTVDLFAIRRGDELLVLGDTPPAVRPGETLDVEVVVRTRGVGHPYTNGTADSNETWVSLEAREPARASSSASGVLDADGPPRRRRRPARDARHRPGRRAHGPPPAAGHPRPALQQRHRARRGARRPLPRHDPEGREGRDHAVGRHALPQVLARLHDLLARRGAAVAAGDDARAATPSTLPARSGSRSPGGSGGAAAGQPRPPLAALERLRHRPLPPGRPQGRRARLDEGRRARAGQAGRPAEPRARRDRRGPARRREGLARRGREAPARAGARRRSSARRSPRTRAGWTTPRRT